MTMVEFYRQASQLENGITENVHCHPSALLEGLATNEILGDEDTSTIFTALIQLGAEVDEDVLEKFTEFNPDYQLSQQVLISTQFPDIKEPEVN